MSRLNNSIVPQGSLLDSEIPAKKEDASWPLGSKGSKRRFRPAVHRNPTSSNAVKTRLEYTNVAELLANGKQRHSISAITLHLDKPMPPMLFDLPADQNASKCGASWRGASQGREQIGPPRH